MQAVDIDAQVAEHKSCNVSLMPDADAENTMRKYFLIASRVGTGTSVEDRKAIHNHLKNNLTKIKPSMYQVSFAPSACHPVL